MYNVAIVDTDSLEIIDDLEFSAESEHAAGELVDRLLKSSASQLEEGAGILVTCAEAEEADDFEDEEEEDE